MWSRISSSMEDHQVVLYLVSLCLGAGVGIVVPQAADPAGRLSGPVLGLLLYATFLAVSFNRVARSLRDWRFLTTVCAVNFLIVPLVIAILSRWVADDRALLVGVLLVLLAPCVDYVIVFTGLAGGAADRLLAATPLLMVLQMLLLPVWLRIFAGQEVIASVNVRPFLSALIWFIFVPLSAGQVFLSGVLCRSP